MAAQIIDGKKIAAELRQKIANQVKTIKTSGKRPPGLAVVLVGESPASQVYVRNKEKFAGEVGINSAVVKLSSEVSEKDLLNKISELNGNEKTDGIIVQLPLPQHINDTAVINAVMPEKDVDGFHVVNVGKLTTGQDDCLVSCTPKGCLVLIKTVIADLTGKHAVIIGRSNIVGKPLASLLLRENCTVTTTHSKTGNIEEICRQADILIAAAGKSEMVKNSWVKPGACVIDVGINRIERDGKTRLVGDVDFGSVKEVAGYITPVPGGVGPMTVACLLENTLQAYGGGKNISEGCS